MRNLPRYKKCFVCGKENPIGLNITFKTDKDKVYASFKPDDRYIGYKDRVHGGIAASLLDEIMGWSCSVVTKKLYYTAELTIRYKRSIPSDSELFAEAYMSKEQHGMCFASAVLKDNNGNVLVTAKGKYFPLNEEAEKEVLKTLHHEPEDAKPVTKDDI
jgi:uncharacterized protein (TIGR00369 family)